MANEQDLEPLLGTQQNQLGIVISEGGGIDGKSLAVAAVNVAALLFVAQADLQVTHWWQHVLLVAPFVLSLLFNVLGTLPKRYIGASIDLDEHPEYLGMDRETLILQLLSDTQNAIAHNYQVNVRYWRYCLVSILLTTSGMILLFAIL